VKLLEGFQILDTDFDLILIKRGETIPRGDIIQERILNIN